MKTKYEDRRLSEMSKAQLERLEAIGARAVGLAITGVLKAMSAKQVYLIGRNGAIRFQARRGRYDYDLHR